MSLITSSQVRFVTFASTLHSQQIGSSKMTITEYTVTVQVVNWHIVFYDVLSNGVYNCYHFSRISQMLSPHARAHSQAKKSWLTNSCGCGNSNYLCAFTGSVTLLSKAQLSFQCVSAVRLL